MKSSKSPQSPDLSAELAAALNAADAAEAVVRKHYRAHATALDVERKADRSPVTEADREAEREIKRVLGDAFPDHGFYGEEYGEENADAACVWLIDPIDGTKSFVRGYPFLSTQIALMRGRELVLGVSNAPVFGQGERAWAEKGKGAFLDGEPLTVSAVDDLAEATLSTGNLATLAQSARWARLGDLIPKLARLRGYGDFYHYHLLAAGKIDAVVESDVNVLDVAALSVIVSEAGGSFTDLEGAPVGLETTSVLATNGKLTEALHSALG